MSGAFVEQNRRLVSAQSTPLLMLDTGNEDNAGKPVLSMTLSNVGTGPAQITWFHISDAQGIDYSGGALTGRVLRLGQNANISNQQIAHTLLRSSDERSVWRWTKPTGNPAALAAWEKLDVSRFQLHASACYCSIFEECKITEFGDSKPKPVSSCDQVSPQR